MLRPVPPYHPDESGVDIDCGSAYTNSLGKAIASGLTSEAVLDASLARTFYLQFLTGRFDPLASQPYTQIPFSALGHPAHTALSFDGALQGACGYGGGGSSGPGVALWFA